METSPWLLAPASLSAREWPKVIHWTGGWVGARAGLGGWKRETSLATAGNRIPDRVTLNIDCAKSVPSRTIKYAYYIYTLLLFGYCFWQVRTCNKISFPFLTFWRRNYFFFILTHPVYKMWIIQEPNMLELWNKLHFEEEKTESIYHV